jgi:hypothetical protein
MARGLKAVIIGSHAHEEAWQKGNRVNKKIKKRESR